MGNKPLYFRAFCIRLMVEDDPNEPTDHGRITWNIKLALQTPSALWGLVFTKNRSISVCVSRFMSPPFILHSWFSESHWKSVQLTLLSLIYSFSHLLIVSNCSRGSKGSWAPDDILQQSISMERDLFGLSNSSHLWEHRFETAYLRKTLGSLGWHGGSWLCTKANMLKGLNRYTKSKMCFQEVQRRSLLKRHLAPP